MGPNGLGLQKLQDGKSMPIMLTPAFIRLAEEMETIRVQMEEQIGLDHVIIFVIPGTSVALKQP